MQNSSFEQRRLNTEIQAIAEMYGHLGGPQIASRLMGDPLGKEKLALELGEKARRLERRLEITRVRKMCRGLQVEHRDPAEYSLTRLIRTQMDMGPQPASAARC